MTNTEAFYRQTQKQSCTLHPAGDHTRISPCPTLLASQRLF